MNILNKLSRIFTRYPTKALLPVANSIDNTLGTLYDDITTLNTKEYIIGSSTGEWLDEWASWFGATRNVGESDASFASRILAGYASPKDTIPALQQIVAAVTGLSPSQVTIYEPYVDMNTVSAAVKAQYPDGYWNYAVIDVQIPYDITSNVQSAVTAGKAGGVSVFYTSLAYLTGDSTYGAVSDRGSEPVSAYEIEINLLADDPNIGNDAAVSAYTMEVSLQATMGKTITASSQIIIQSIMGDTITEANVLEDNTQLPVEITVSPA